MRVAKNNENPSWKMGCGSSSPNPVGQKNKTRESMTPISTTVLPEKAARVGELLRDVPILRGLNVDERIKLATLMDHVIYEADRMVFKQGDAGNLFYIIIKGQAEVTRTEGSGVEVLLAILKQGDYFGETALQNNAPRGESVKAKETLHLLALSREKFTTLVSSSISFVDRRIGISGEVGDGSSSPDRPDAIDPHQPPQNAIREKSDVVKKLIEKAVEKSPLFSGLANEHREAVINLMYRAEIKQGISCIKQRDPGNNLFVVETGMFHVFVDNKKVFEQGPGTLFGELALIYNAPRAATVTAMQNSIVWKIDRYTFRRIAKEQAAGDLMHRQEFLSRIDILSSLTKKERELIAESMDEIKFEKDQVIFLQGDPGTCMYIIKSGEVQISKKETAGRRASVIVNRIRVGGYFGERALLTNEPRAASVKAVTNVVLLQVKEHDFKVLLGSLADIMATRIKTYTSDAIIEKVCKVVKRELKQIQLIDLQSIGTLGKGSFGHVQLVAHKQTKVTYALKMVNKQQVVATHQQAHILSEKETMLQMQHPFLIELFATYKDANMIYFLLEPVMGGELFSLLRRSKMFDEEVAKFYAGCVISAFEYMHSKNFVYRDLKPENLLLDSEGFIKITDFGFAKRMLPDDKTWTLCGTPDYLAPEIVSGKGHNRAVDWWTVGVLIYEMMASYTPFYHQNQLKMYEKIVNGQYRCPAHFSFSTRDIITGLLDNKSHQRLGMLAGGARLLKTHEWFAAFDWEALESKKMKAPFILPVQNSHDLSNFDKYDENVEVMPYLDDGTNWDATF